MGIEEIKNEIINESLEEGRKIVEESQKKAEKILKEAEEKAALVRQTARHGAEREAAGLMQTALSSARIEANKKVLKVKHEILSRVIERTSAELTSNREYGENLKKAVAANEKNALKIFLSKQDFEKFKPASAKIEPRDIKGGFIARFADFESNMTIDAVLKINEQELAREVGKILFS